jgi:hypothetical protein
VSDWNQPAIPTSATELPFELTHDSIVKGEGIELSVETLTYSESVAVSRTAVLPSPVAPGTPRVGALTYAPLLGPTTSSATVPEASPKRQYAEGLSASTAWLYELPLVPIVLMSCDRSAPPSAVGGVMPSFGGSPHGFFGTTGGEPSVPPSCP